MRHLFFDMDGTLTESRQTITQEMVEAINSLPELPIVISGADVYQMAKQLRGARVLSLSQNGNYTPLWTNTLTDDQKHAVIKVVERTVPLQDDMLEDRGCQISVSFTGHHAQKEIKESYDPGGIKRLALLSKFSEDIDALKELGVQVKVGGTTCLDFFRKTKGENLKEFITRVKWKPEDCIYIGDALYPGGNDESVHGVMTTHSVSSPTETLAFLKTLQ